MRRPARAPQRAFARMHEWDRYTDMNTRLGGADRRVRAARALDPQAAAQHGPRLAARRARGRAGARTTRACRRSGGRAAARWAWPAAPRPAARRTSGDFAAMIINNDASGLNANSYVRMMPHTTAANIGIFFGAQGPHHPDLERLHVGQPGHRLRLRGDQVRPPDADARRRRRGAVPDRGDGVRHAVRHQPAQRRAAHDAASVRSRPRRPGGRRGRRQLVLEELEHARRAARASTRRSSASAPTPTACTSRKPEEATHARWSWSWRSQDAGLCRRTRSATSTAMARRPSTATSPRRARRPRCSARAMPLSSQKSYLGHTLGACGALEAWFSIEMMNATAGSRRRSTSTTSIRAAASSTTSSAKAASCTTEYVMSNNFAFGGVNTSLVFRRWQC